MKKRLDLASWWMEHAKIEAEQTVSKMIEYGSGDLVNIGHRMAQMAHMEQIDDAAAFELGCLFYLIGKIERVISAVERHDRASDDTWFDIAVYAKMVQARRQNTWT